MRQRRRAERGGASQLRDLSQPLVNHHEVEKKQTQLLLVGVGFAVAIVIVLLAYGWFSSAYQPPRKTIAEVSGQPITLADLVPYTQLESSISGYLNPQSSLNSLIRDAVTRAYAHELGVEVTATDIDATIITQFDAIPPDASVPADSLSETGMATYEQFLGTLNVTKDEYRPWLAGRLYASELQVYFESESPGIAEQVFLEWIITGSTVTGQQAIDRVNAGENFALVAEELNEEKVVSNGEGQVGWVPRGVIQELDSILFADDLVLNELIGPLVTTAGSVVLRVKEGPSEQPVDATMRELASSSAFQSWLDAKVLDAIVDFDTNGLASDDAQWVIDQIL
jgi:hypothetical protein